MKSSASLGLMAAFGFLLVGCDPNKPVAKQETEERINPAEHILARLDSIVFPVVNFEEVRLEEAFDFIRLRSLELDPEPDPARKGVSFLIKGGKATIVDEHGRLPSINFKAEKIKMLDLITEIAVRARLDAYLTSRGIVLLPEGENPIDEGAEFEIWKVLRKTAKTSN